MHKSVIAVVSGITVTVVVVVAYLAWRSTSTCDGIYQQTALQLETKLEFLETAGGLIVGEKAVQKLSDHAQEIALNLKTCCAVLDAGKLSSSEFLTCKAGPQRYEARVDEIVASVKAAGGNGENTVVSEQEKKAIEKKVDAAVADSEEYAKMVAAIESSPPQPAASAEEVEPNNSVLEAQPIAWNATVSGTVGPKEGDVDVFKITNPQALRDRINISVQNRSTTLAPQLDVYSQRKSHMFDKYDYTKGADLEASLIADEGASYFLEVGSMSSTAGEYTLKVEPQRAYDHAEPNDQIEDAVPLKVGATMAASVLDKEDRDWYRIDGATEGALVIEIRNESTTLAPSVDVYDANKSSILSKYDYTAGADLTFAAALDRPTPYFVGVSSQGTGGEYTLTTSLR